MAPVLCVSSRYREFFCLSYFAFLIVVWSVILVFYLPVGPEPTDDIFYIDAATKLATGEYVPPSPNFPYHHYLRWSVIIPLGFLLRVFDFSTLALSIFSVFHLFAIQVVTYALAFRIYASHLCAAGASLAVFVIPTGMLPLLIRSEPAAVLLGMLALACLAWRDGGPRRFLLVSAGVCLAIAIEATEISIFSVPLAVMFLIGTASNADIWGQPECGRKLTWELIWLLAGLAGTKLLVMTIEGLAFGDPFIKVHAIGWWHMRNIDWHALRQGYFDPGNGNLFIFGFILRLLREQTLFSLFVFLVLILAITSRSAQSRPRVLLTSALVGILTLELVGPLVLQKFYLRFLAIPCFVLTAALLVEWVQFFSARKLTAVARGAVVALALAFQVSQAWKIALQDDVWVYYFRDPIVLMKTDADRSQTKSDQVQIFFETEGPRSLIPWSLAVGVYSGRRFSGDNILAPSPPKPEALRALNFYVIESEEGSAPNGFIELPYMTGAPKRRPRVFVHRQP